MPDLAEIDTQGAPPKQNSDNIWLRHTPLLQSTVCIQNEKNKNAADKGNLLVCEAKLFSKDKRKAQVWKKGGQINGENCPR